MRVVARCHHSYLLRRGDGADVVAAVEEAARTRLTAILPAHRVA